MSTHTVILTEELERFVSDEVQSGRYKDESEMMRVALKTLAREERQEREYEGRVVALRAAIEAGDASGIAQGNVFERVRQKLGLRPGTQG
jgi:antitoxin ParD1/3/4